MMNRFWILPVLGLFVLSMGCQRLQKHGQLPIEKALPSPMAKAQLPSAPTPVGDATAKSKNTLPDTTEYRAVAIPPQPQPVAPGAEVKREGLILTSAETEAPDDEKKRILDRIREKREERKEERDKPKEAPKDSPKLPSPFAPKDGKESNKDSKDAPAAPMPKATGDKPGDSNGVAVARKYIDIAMARFEKFADSESLMLRREVVNGKEGQTEEIQFQFRKQPFSVYMKNIGDVGKGREVLYVDGKFDSLLHVVTGKGDNLLIGAGFKTSLKPDSTMATSKSRHKITEAGPGQMLAKIEKHIKAAEAGQRAIKSLGTVQRKEFDYPLEGIEIVLTPGLDPLLPKGGKWDIYFDPKPESPSYGFAVVLITFEGEKEVEYYALTKWKVPANLTDADFHPDRLGGKKK
jgi:Protein of unknown function (DUF1571)